MWVSVSIRKPKYTSSTIPYTILHNTTHSYTYAHANYLALKSPKYLKFLGSRYKHTHTKNKTIVVWFYYQIPFGNCFPSSSVQEFFFFSSNTFWHFFFPANFYAGISFFPGFGFLRVAHPYFSIVHFCAPSIQSHFFVDPSRCCLFI